MKLNLAILFIFCITSIFAQSFEYDLNVIDIGDKPSYVKEHNYSFTLEDKVYLITHYNGYYDLLEYDGVEVKKIIENVDGGIRYYGKLNNEILLTLGSYSNTLYLYKLDSNTSELIQLYEFEHNIKGLQTYGDHAIFLDVHDRLLTTDGTPDGTFLIHQYDDISDNEKLQSKVSDGVIFRADNQIWKSDGTIAGTKAVSSVNLSSSDSFVQSGEFLYFIKTEYNPYMKRVWRTDGTDSGTTLITSAQDTFNDIYKLYPIDNGVLFFGETKEFGTELWTCLEDENTSKLLVDLIPGPESGVLDDLSAGSNYSDFSFVTRDNVILFRGASSNVGQVWKTDGTVSNTKAVLDFTGQAGYEDFEIDVDYVRSSETGNYFFFTKSNNDEKKFWVFNQSNQEVIFLADMDAAYVSEAISSEDQYYFTFYSSGHQLWTSDGTPEGTIHLNTNTLEPKFKGAKDGHLFYSMLDKKPYISDGSISGTGLLKDLVIGSSGTTPNFDENLFFEYNNTCYFTASDKISGLSFYSTDYTPSGTNFRADIYPNTFGVDIDNLTKAGNKLYFTINDSLWVSDGTVDGSKNLGQPFNNLSFYYGSTPSHLFYVHEDDLYATDGTLDGTYFLLHGDNFFGNTDYSRFKDNKAASMNGLLWFFYDDGINGMELYRSGGKITNTYSSFESMPMEETIFNFSSSHTAFYDNRLFFLNEDDEFGKELWTSNGTLAGTSLFKDINPGPSNSTPRHMVEANGKLFFITASNKFKMYVTDGTGSGTVELAEIPMSAQNGIGVIGDDIIFCSGKDLWKSDGTSSGTVLLRDNDKQPKSLRNIGDKVIFAFDDGVNGQEPWITDGTEAGTKLLKDINPGSNSSDIDQIGTIKNLAFFSVDTVSFSNRRLWVTNGLEDSTFRSQYSPSPISGAKDFYKINNRLYFIANNNFFGRELHYLDFEIPVFSINGTVFNDQNGNGIKDNNESGILNIRILSGNGNEYTTLTNSDGEYELSLPKGNYIIKPVFDQCWTISSDSTSYNITVIDQAIDSLDFGLKNMMDSDSIEPQVSLYSSATRCGFTVSNWLNIRNIGCDTLSTLVSLELDSLVSFVDAAIPPDSIDGQNLFWLIDSIEASQQFQIQMNLLMPNEQFVDEIISHKVKSYVEVMDSFILKEEFDYYSVISCAIDPNDKQVMPSREDLSEENYTLFEETLTYHIRFQNTGNDTAFTVRIVDNISNLLDIQTLIPKAASHNYKVNIFPNNVVEFLFEDILLPDSTTNEILSHGFVAFEIQTIDDLEEFSVIKNKAEIYFDFNRAIVTNTITNTMVSTFDSDSDGFDLWNDCDDMNPNVNSNNPEIPYNGFDDDCDPLTLDDDFDQDGYLLVDDCDDTNAEINPGVAEIPYNGIDDDCNELTLDDDLDEDGFLLSEDCDDTNPDINPDATEIANNGIDEDCDGKDWIVSVHSPQIPSLLLIPNPTNGILTIDLPINGYGVISMYNISGQKISEDYIYNEITLDLSNLDSGVYIVKVKSQDYQWIKKVIKIN